MKDDEITLNNFCWDVAYLTNECGMNEFKAIGLIQDLKQHSQELIMKIEGEKRGVIVMLQFVIVKER